MIFGPENVSNGASGDIKMATDLARRMVTEWGMSEKIGLVSYAENEQEVFLGHSMGQGKNISSETVHEIEAEVKRLIDDAHKRATALLEEHREDLERLAQGLLEYETLSGEEIRQVLRGEKIERSLVDDTTKKLRSSIDVAHHSGDNVGSDKIKKDDAGHADNPVPATGVNFEEHN